MAPAFPRSRRRLDGARQLPGCKNPGEITALILAAYTSNAKMVAHPAARRSITTPT
jgi:hypothetical protein